MAAYYSHSEDATIYSNPHEIPTTRDFFPTTFCFLRDDAGSDPDSVIFSESDVPDDENQVDFLMDLFQQHEDHSQIIDFATCARTDRFSDESVPENLNLNLGLGFDSDSVEHTRHQNSVNTENKNSLNYDAFNSTADSDVDEGLLLGGHDSTDQSRESDSVIVPPANVIWDLDSGLRLDGEDIITSLPELFLPDDEYELENFDPDNSNFVADDGNMYDVFFWDSACSENQRQNNEDFEWVEVDEHGDEREYETICFDDEEPAAWRPNSASHEDPDGQFSLFGFGNLDWDEFMSGNHTEWDPFVFEEDDIDYDVDYFEHAARISAIDYEEFYPRPASASIVERLPSFVITRENVENHFVDCVICKDRIRMGDRVTVLPCSHKYHGDCIFSWLKRMNTCPLCRFRLPPECSISPCSPIEAS